MVLASSLRSPSTTRQSGVLRCTGFVLAMVSLLPNGSCQVQKATNLPQLTRRLSKRPLDDQPLSLLRTSSVSGMPRNETMDSSADHDIFSNDYQSIDVSASTSDDQYLKADSGDNIDAIQSSSSSAGIKRLAVIAVSLSAAFAFSMLAIFAWASRKYQLTSMVMTASGQADSDEFNNDIGPNTKRPQHRSVDAGLSILKNGVQEVSDRLFV
jgi:hypothetical protein